MTNTVADDTPFPADSDYTWADLPTVRPSLEECKKQIVKWESGSSRPFAGMPRPSDVDFEKRFKRAYQDICAKVDVIAQDPKAPIAIGIFGALNVMAPGFADNLVIDDQVFLANASPKHVFRGFPALVAGRYRQERESEEGKRGLAEVARMDARFGDGAERPTAREVDACIDHRVELNINDPPTR